MLTLLKGSTVAAGVLAATVTGIVFAQTGQGSAAGTAVPAGAPLSASAGKHHGHHGRHGHHTGAAGLGSGSGSGPGGTGGGSGGSGSGSGGSGPGGPGPGGPVPAGPHKVLTPFRPSFPPAGLVLPSVPTLPTPAGTIGLPGVPCLMGSQVPNTTHNDYAIACETVSGRWSNRVPVDSSCASL
jgi:hypothetical protein